jgi:hypothetical protein
MRKPATHWLEALVAGSWLGAWLYAALVVVLLFACTDSLAQFSCVPKAIGSPNGTGSRMVSKSTPLGDWRYLWCPEPGAVYPDGRIAAWRVERHVVLAKYRGASENLATMAWAVFSAPDPLAALNSAITLGTIKPQTPQELYEFRLLWRDACIDAYSPPYVIEITPRASAEVSCGPVPTPPVVAAVWLVAPNSASTTVPPTRPMYEPTGAKTVGERATVGAVCNEAATPVLKGTQTLLPIKGGSTNVTACVRNP